MKHEELFIKLHSNYNIEYALYDGFSIRIVLEYRSLAYNYTLEIETDMTADYTCVAKAPDGKTYETNESVTKFVKKLVKYMVKRACKYKDPFKYITGVA